MSEIFFEILSRVHSFTISNWIYTDAKQLNPYKLASLGYYLSRPLILECSVCHNQISVPRQLEMNLQQITQKLKNHKKNCIYHMDNLEEENPEQPFTKQQVYLLMDDIITQTKTSYQLLVQAKTYPILNKSQIEKCLAVDIFTLKFIYQAYKINWPKELKITFFLLLFGWSVKKNQNNNKLILSCRFCGRQVDLENFKHLEQDSQPQNLIFSQTKVFDPISQHRYFCFWVRSLPFLQYPGFSILIQHFYDKINQSKSLFSKREPEQTKKIRVQLDKYLQSFNQKTTQQFQKIKGIFEQCQKMRKLVEQNDQNNEGKITQNQFAEAQKRMKQFVENDIGDQVKGQIKKIKLS